ncbi:MAG: carboxypeptidase regulatory-like domain-containing protein [Pirellulales bacterium]|nr:carboxypeptidase regulatory-like domain-containing protein [Pirellulales bacterium]
MKRMVWWQRAMLLLASLGLLIPSPVMAATAAPAGAAGKTQTPVLKPLDVELHKGGMLVGQIVNPQGAPQGKVPVSLFHGDKNLVTTTTNQGGFFAVKGVSAGTYRIAADKTQGVYRLWATGTAPPGAQPGTLMVVGQGAVRGQSGPIGYWLGNPWVIAGLVAAAVAIPVAIHNYQIDHDDPQS